MTRLRIYSATEEWQMKYDSLDAAMRDKLILEDLGYRVEVLGNGK